MTFVVSEILCTLLVEKGTSNFTRAQKKSSQHRIMLQYFSEVTGCKVRDFGYAGLKDKEGMTTQYISLHKNFEAKLAHFSHEKN